ncbi:hypothetical protein LEN26_001057 [Aphanomyces euteiches]|nr:hypothetical protein LEN26_001057 [Aphanomyces euteiches]
MDVPMLAFTFASLVTLVCADTVVAPCSSYNLSTPVCLENAIDKSQSPVVPLHSTLDLSSLGIQAIQDIRHVPLVQVNLSSNALSSTDEIFQLPPSIQILDLSYNRFNLLFQTNFSYFVNLTTLILRGNNISTMVENVSFPPSLTSLDLFDNPLATVDLRRETFAQLMHINITMQTKYQGGDVIDKKALCPSGLVYVLPSIHAWDATVASHNVVCVVDPYVPTHSNSIKGFLLIAGASLFCLVLMVVLVFNAGRYKHRDHNLRETFVSSIDGDVSPAAVEMSAISRADDEEKVEVDQW